ncbi:phosphoglycerate mutase family protein [Gleimia coleocanis DSM 15436]|uniref:Phosphoglycerate mutase family protein n=1 Tax=Gleimia coleocanis DSM 15436 TaxID=525245 RepID=C0VZF7_9ACTO|nr:histidine phosphatase family protein [Gleimia coleocanis]EEH64258.1 phosphoglycerate mutase family protein [Gleimia coleocanis DSM 15436]
MGFKLVLIRHGQTELNVQKRFQGQSDVPLNEVGRQQAQQMAEVLGKLPLAAIFSSDLSRAFDTASALAEVTSLPVQVDVRFRERFFGEFEGKNEAELRGTELESAFEQWRNTGDAVSAGVELRAAVGQRVVEAVTLLRAEYPEGTVAVVAHGSTLTQGVVALLGLDPSTWAGFHGLDNCHWAVLEPTRRAPGWRVVEYNAHA